MSYKNEAAFSRALIPRLRKYLSLVQRIETGLIGRGVPDLYVGNGMWIELKNMPHATINQTMYEIPWRPGQQAWALLHARTGKPVHTLCAVQHGFLVIPMVRHFVHNIVSQVECEKVFGISACVAKVVEYVSGSR